MTDPLDHSNPGHRNGRRRFIRGGALLLLLIAFWLLVPRTSVVERARSIRVGQPREEVIRLMGQPRLTYFGGPGNAGERYSDMSSLELTARVLINQYLGFASMPHMDTYPVDLQYDADRRVKRIRIKDSGSNQYVEH